MAETELVGCVFLLHVLARCRVVSKLQSEPDGSTTPTFTCCAETRLSHGFPYWRAAALHLRCQQLDSHPRTTLVGCASLSNPPSLGHAILCTPLKLASPDRSTESTLKRIYGSGEWSDLTISTATRGFRVHKNIVCPACPFFEAALTRDFQEAHTGVVKLPESAETVDGMLRFIYGFDVGQATVEHAVATNTEHLRECVDLHVAADKYDLPGLRAITRRSLITYIRCLNKASRLVDVGLYIYQQTPGTIDDLIIEHLLSVTATNMPRIRRHKSLWQRFVSHEEFLTAVMDVVFKTADWAPLEALTGPDMEKEQLEDVSRIVAALLDSVT